MPVMPVKNLKFPCTFSHIQEPAVHSITHPVHLFYDSPVLITGNFVIIYSIDQLIFIFTVSCKQVDLVSPCRESIRELGYVGRESSYTY
jgi:hypothetical protein